MGRYFGTDGIRGVASEELSVKLSYLTGRAVAAVLLENSSEKVRVLIGRDTRISGDMIESALAAGLCAMGAEVALLGVLPTPAVAYLTRKEEASAGIVISASHNSYEHNGIKVFFSDGYKLSDQMEARIEHFIDHPDEIKDKTHAQIGRVFRSDGDLARTYIDHLISTVPHDLSGLKIAVDCAHGASYETASILFERLKTDAAVYFNTPSGTNINENCGSTHMERLKQIVVDGGYDLGVAFDGDADRCLVIDERGELIDGDRLMAICAFVWQKAGRLSKNAFVATVASNVGLHRFAEEHGISVVVSDIGDRYVLEKMREGRYNLGGEQSGHVIFSDYATTGDGQLTAIQLMAILKSEGKSASYFTNLIKPYPQRMINVEVSRERKQEIMTNPEIKALIDSQTAEFKGKGRILVRPSGTEALIRVMAEGEDEARVNACTERIAQAIKDA